MSINYAKIGKRNRRLSLNSDLMQIHNSSKNNKTNQFSISLHQSQQAFNQKNISKVDLETPIEDPKSNFIGSKPKSEYTRKKFSFNDRNKMTNFLNIINDYIKQLDESSNCSTLPSDIQNKLENMLFLKFHIIQKRQEQLKIKYKQLQQDNAIENYENQTLKNKLFDLHNHVEELTRINYIQQLNLDKQKQKNKQLKLRYQYLSNSYLREKLKYENQKLKLKQNSISIQENNIVQIFNDTVITLIILRFIFFNLQYQQKYNLQFVILRIIKFLQSKIQSFLMYLVSRYKLIKLDNGLQQCQKISKNINSKVKIQQQIN